MLPGSKDPDINSVQAVALKTLMANYEGIAAGGTAGNRGSCIGIHRKQYTKERCGAAVTASCERYRHVPGTAWKGPTPQGRPQSLIMPRSCVLRPGREWEAYQTVELLLFLQLHAMLRCAYRYHTCPPSPLLAELLPNHGSKQPPRQPGHST